MNVGGLHLLRMAACLIMLMCGVQLAAQADEIPPENFTLVDSLLRRAADTVLNKLDHYVVESTDSVYIIDISPHSAAWLLGGMIIDKYIKVNWQRPDQESDLPQLNLNILRCGVQYRLDSTDAELLHRTVEVQVNASLTTSAGRIVRLCEFRDSYTDIFNRQQLNYAQATNYDFAYAEPPEAPRDFFDEIVEPLVAVSAAVVTVVLLFTVRSQ